MTCCYRGFVFSLYRVTRPVFGPVPVPLVPTGRAEIVPIDPLHVLKLVLDLSGGAVWATWDLRPLDPMNLTIISHNVSKLFRLL